MIIEGLFDPGINASCGELSPIILAATLIMSNKLIDKERIKVIF